jgi:hypothetical protein
MGPSTLVLTLFKITPYGFRLFTVHVCTNVYEFVIVRTDDCNAIVGSRGIRKKSKRKIVQHKQHTTDAICFLFLRRASYWS